MLTVNQNKHKDGKFATLLVNHRLVISSEYYSINLEPVTFHIRFWFNDVNSAQERQWMVL